MVTAVAISKVVGFFKPNVTTGTKDLAENVTAISETTNAPSLIENTSSRGLNNLANVTGNNTASHIGSGLSQASKNAIQLPSITIVGNVLNYSDLVAQISLQALTQLNADLLQNTLEGYNAHGDLSIETVNKFRSRHGMIQEAREYVAKELKTRQFVEATLINGISVATMFSGMGSVMNAGKGVVQSLAKEALENGVKRAVNSKLPHAIERSVTRGVFETEKLAQKALKDLTKNIGKGGFPKGTIVDPSYADRLLVPIGKEGLAVYKVAANNTAKLRTVLIKR